MRTKIAAYRDPHREITELDGGGTDCEESAAQQ
jgi:hypothetical protein